MYLNSHRFAENNMWMTSSSVLKFPFKYESIVCPTDVFLSSFIKKNEQKPPFYKIIPGNLMILAGLFIEFR